MGLLLCDDFFGKYKNSPVFFLSFKPTSAPLVLRDWCPDFKLEEDFLTRILTWVQFPRLGLEYWGQKALGKVAGNVGIPICTDQLTATKGRISYARVLVEVHTDRELVEEIRFTDPRGVVVKPRVIYKWKPIVFKQCSMWGHHENECRKKKPLVQN